MLRDDGNHGGPRRISGRNVLGESLEICSITPMTGFYRDGDGTPGERTFGSHTVCTVMTSEFLEFSKARGNDLSTPLSEFGFPVLKPVTVGVYVRPAGKRHSRRTERPAWSCVLLTKVR